LDQILSLSSSGRNAATSGGGATTTTTSKPQAIVRSEISPAASQQEESVDIDSTNRIRNSHFLASDQDQHLHDHEKDFSDEEQGGIVDNSSNGVPLVAIKEDEGQNDESPPNDTLVAIQEDEGQKDESPPNDISHVPVTTTTFKSRPPVRTSWAGTVVPMGDDQEQE
jgi:hypothetical protein